MKVKCIDTGNNLNLTIGKVYEVLKDSCLGGYSGFWIFNDRGIKDWYKKERFKIINECVNNEYDIYEIISDFKEGVIFNCKEPSCYKADKFKIQNRKLMILDHLGKWNEFKSIPGSTLSMRFTMQPIQKPVAFDQVLGSDKRCKVELELANIEIGYGYFTDVITLIGKEYGDVVAKKIFKEGKWYLEE